MPRKSLSTRSMFPLTGLITRWNPVTRQLTILGRDIVLGSRVSTVGVARWARRGGR